MKGKSILKLTGLFLLTGIIAFIALFGVQIGSFQIKPINQSLKYGLDIEGGVAVVYEAKTELQGEELRKALDQTKGIIEKRINALGLTEPVVTLSGNNRIRVELPGEKNADSAIKLIGKTANLEFIIVSKNSFAQDGMRKKDFDGNFIFNGSAIKNSTFTRDEHGAPAVSLEFTPEGQAKFSEATKLTSSMGGGQIAILLDDVVISAPRSASHITDGHASISGNFTIDEATNLSKLIRGGALPVSLQEVRSSVTGPTLGLNALNKAVQAAQAGLIIVIAFMIIYYRYPGLVTAWALVIYGLLLLTIMALIKATITLPGIAGILLSAGIAVDANVIIFEKIKEELRMGKTIRASIDAGFKRAFVTIAESNSTTLVACAVLYGIGEGPIRGFAITLAIGVICSVFTSIVVSKFIMRNISEAGFFNKNIFFGVTYMEHERPAKNLRIVEKFRIWFAITGLIMAVGLGSIAVNGLNLGIDFTGGTMMQINVGKTLSIEEVSAEIADFNLNPEIQHAGNAKDEVIIKTKTSLDTKQRKAVFEKFKKKYNLKDEAFSSEQFGPSIGAEIEKTALTAVLVAAAAMLLFITVRFEFKFAVASIVALFHDVLILFAIYAFFKIPFNMSFIAAMLTVVGYSMNDTIVVFDRIRENNTSIKKKDPIEIANESLWQVLPRSVNTTLATLIVVGALFILGVPSIKEFTLPLLSGVFFGAFSSVFIATPIWAIWSSKKSIRQVK